MAAAPRAKHAASAADKAAVRAKRRAKKAVSSPASSGQTAAEAASITPGTKKAYQDAYALFLAWAEDKHDAVAADPKQLDDILVEYLDTEMFAAGRDTGDAKNAVFGTIFCRSMPRGSTSLPRCRRAIQGFLKDNPPRSEDPCPLEAAAVIAHGLLSQATLEARLTGLAFIVQYDLFARPSEVLNLKASDIVYPNVGRYRQVSVIIAPSAEDNDRNALEAKPAKSGEFDDTIIAGLSGMKLEFVPTVLRHLRNAAGDGTLFAPLTLHRYENELKEGVAAAGLAHMHITPHSARHGGASTASFMKILKIKEIQRRGRWLAPKSLRRYEKTGKLTRQVALMPPAVVRAGEELLIEKLKHTCTSTAMTIAKLRRNFTVPPL